MPRHVTKTYGRPAGSQQNSRVFDDIVKDPIKITAAQTASTIHRWGKTSFTSKRNTQLPEPDSRKRKIEDDELEDDEESVGEPSLFDDPFSFDSDDDGPTQPKRGMGFKPNKNKKTNSRPNTKAQSRTDSLLNSDHKSEVSAFSKSASRTYTRVGKPSLAKAASASLPSQTASSSTHNKHQLSMDAFTQRLSHKASSLPATSFKSSPAPEPVAKEEEEVEEDLETRWARITCNSNTKTVRKFFTSSQNSTGTTEDHTYSQTSASGSVISISSSGASPEKEDHTYSHTAQGNSNTANTAAAASSRRVQTLRKEGAQGRDALDNIWESDPDSDWDKDSGDPEIIFNSPKKKADLQRLDSHKGTQDSPLALDNCSDDNDTNSMCSNSSSSKADLLQQSKLAVDSIKTYGPKKTVAPSGGNKSTLDTLASNTTSNGMQKMATTRKLMFRSSRSGEEKKTEGPLVRRLLTSPKKVSSTKICICIVNGLL